MIHVETKQITLVDKDKLFRLIVDYAKYPDFVYGVKSARVLKKSKNKARVTFTISIIKDLVYTVDLVENKSLGTVTWHLLQSDTFKINNGFWSLMDLGSGKSEVRYGWDFEFKVPIPGFFLKRLVKVILPLMIRSFEKRAQQF